MDRSTAPRAFSLPDAVDLTVCDREPIHIPGAIQPHGLLLVADPATFAVVAGAGALEEIVGPEWLGASLPHLLQQDIAALVEGVHLGPGGTVLGTRFLDYDVALHRTDSWLLAELEPVGDDRRSAGEILTWLDTIATGFERASTLTALCDRAAVAFRALTGFDRVMIYRFLDDDAGRVIAEDRDRSLDAFLHHHFPASDIPRQARALYVRNRTRAIPNITYAPAPIRPAGFDTIDLSDVAVRSVSPIHLQYLRNMGVEASASISIVKDGMLWGLIACHHHSPRLLPRSIRAACSALAGGLARQIRAKEEADDYRERLTLRGEEDLLRPILMADGAEVGLTPVVKLRGDDLRRMFGADGLAVVDQGRITAASGAFPDGAALTAFADWLEDRDDRALFSTRELATEWRDAARFGIFTGVLAMRFDDGQSLVWLRAEQIEEVEWAGNPHKAIPHDPGAPLRPRQSFESWREQVRGRSRRWTLEQLEAARRLQRLIRDGRIAGDLRRLNRELERTGLEKDAALAQKDLLMREVDHRVQNSLQLVSSFLAIQARDVGPGPVADHLTEARSRLSAVALVHRRLYRDDQIETIHLDRYLAELMEDLKSSLGADWAREMTLDLAPVLIPTDRAVNVGLIAAELVINATKYAYPGRGSGAIDVVLEQHRNRLRLVVADRGVGKSGLGEGFGSRMMAAVVQRIGGEIAYLDNEPGLRAVLTAPITE